MRFYSKDILENILFYISTIVALNQT